MKQQAEPVADKAQCDGGACGVGGYCDECPKRQAEPVAVQLEPFIEEASTSVLVLSGEKWVREGRAVSTAVQAEPVSLRPKQHDYASYVGYTRALEAYCDGLEQAEPVADAVRGECRLWDSQWTNVVNHADCYRDWNTEDAIRHAVWMTETYMAHNVARNYFPPAKQAEPVQAEPVVTWGVDWGEDEDWVSIVKRHPDGTLEVVATEGRPVKRQAEPVVDSGNPSF